MAVRPYNVLFLCTGNSARSILAERIINQWGRGRFRGFSAGSHPKRVVHPIALELLKKMNLPTEGLRSKSWDEFAAPGAPPGMPDPAAVEGSEPQRWVAFRAAFNALENRIKIFTSLPLASIDRMKLQERLDAIRTSDTTPRESA